MDREGKKEERKRIGYNWNDHIVVEETSREQRESSLQSISASMRNQIS